MPHELTTADVERLAATSTADCYQCGKCSAGCPVAAHMDLMPSQLVGLVQTGSIGRAIAAEGIWKCVSCMTCSARCPKAVDCAALIDALRQLAVRKGVASKLRRRTILFQQAFLDNIRRNGRLREVKLIGVFKTKAFLHDRNVPLLLKDASLGPKLMRRGKLRLRGKAIKDPALIARIFDRCQD